METGIKGSMQIKVTSEITAEEVGSGQLSVLATPVMISLMEETAWKSVAPYLEEGQGTVGTLMNVRHLFATPVGMNLKIETELTEIDRRRLVFLVKASDEAGLVGEGVHERFIIDNEKFFSKATAKLDKA